MSNKFPCAFCGAYEFEREIVVAGPCNINICSDCVAKCAELIEEKRASKGVSLAACPVGLFWYGETLCLKTEYRGDDGRRIEAYIVESGEFFWGDNPQTIESQRAQIVMPIPTRFALAALKSGGAPR